MEQVGATVSNQHSIWQILNHMIYWQEYILRILKEEKIMPPKHASETWPTEIKPPTKKDWDLAVYKFKDGLNEAALFAKNQHDLSKGQVGHLLSLIAHNSYHSGQVVMIRRSLNQWPPPMGGDTW